MRLKVAMFKHYLRGVSKFSSDLNVEVLQWKERVIALTQSSSYPKKFMFPLTSKFEGFLKFTQEAY